MHSDYGQDHRVLVIGVTYTVSLLYCMYSDNSNNNSISSNINNNKIIVIIIHGRQWLTLRAVADVADPLTALTGKVPRLLTLVASDHHVVSHALNPRVLRHVQIRTSYHWSPNHNAPVSIKKTTDACVKWSFELATFTDKADTRLTVSWQLVHSCRTQI